MTTKAASLEHHDVEPHVNGRETTTMVAKDVEVEDEVSAVGVTLVQRRH